MWLLHGERKGDHSVGRHVGMACNLFVALRIEDGNFDGQLVVGVVVDAPQPL